MTNVTCGLTAKKPGLAPSPTLVIEYETSLLFGLIIQHFYWENSVLGTSAFISATDVNIGCAELELKFSLLVQFVQ